MVVVFQLFVHDRFNFMRHADAEREQSKVIAKKLQGVMIVGETGEFLEKGAFLRFLDMAF